MASTFISFWNFCKNDPAIVHDYSTNERHSSSATDLSIIAGDVVGYSGSFNGTTAQVNFGNITAVNGIAAMSIMAKIYITAYGTTKPIFSKSGHHDVYVDSSGKLNFKIYFGVPKGVVSAASVQLNQWVTIIAMYDGSEMSIYQDGVKDSNTTSATGNLPSAATSLYMGYDGLNYFAGKNECSSYYNRSLNADELSYLSSNPNGTPRLTLGDTIVTGDLLIQDIIADTISGSEVCTYFDSTNGLYYSIPIDVSFSPSSYASHCGSVYDTSRQVAFVNQRDRVLVQTAVSKFSHLFDSTKTAWGYDRRNPSAIVLTMPLTAGAIWAGNVSGKATEIAAVAVGSILAANGVSTSPIWTSSPTISTSVTCPLHIGGTGVGSFAAIQSTSGVGTTDHIKFLVGNNGATEAARILNGGQLVIGATSLVSTELVSIQKSQNDNTMLLLKNATSGTNALTQIRLVDAAGTLFIISNASAGYSSTGMELASATNIRTTAPQGLNIGTTGNTELSLWTNNTKRVRLTNAGRMSIGGAFVGTEYLNVFVNQNASTELIITNETSGTASGARIYNRTLSSNIITEALSAAFTTSGIKEASTGVCYVSSGNALNVGTTINIPLTFWTNNTKRATILGAGEFIWGATALLSTEVVSIQKNQNSITRLIVSNETDNTAARTFITIATTGLAGLNLGANAPTYTTSGINVADTAVVYANGQTGGLNIGTFTSAQLGLWTNNVKRFSISSSGSLTGESGNGITLNSANFATDTTTGTKIGTATNQKISLWNATPIIQPTTADASATFVQNAGNSVNDASTFDGYTVAQVVKALRNFGALA